MSISIAKNMDCMDAMREMKDNEFDLAICDPPYGIGINHSIGRREGQAPSGHAPVRWDNEPPSTDYFRELRRVSVNQIVWGANYFISRMPFDTPCWILWDKQYSFDVTFAQYEMAWTSFSTSAKKFELTNNASGKIHPTQKPVALYKWLLTNYAKHGDKILDTHLGSGSSRIAAYDLGFDFTGYELDKDYFEAQEQRFANHIAQPKLFVPTTSTEQAALFEKEGMPAIASGGMSPENA